MPEEPYSVLLESLARRLRGVDPAALGHVQSLQIDGRCIDFSLQRDRYDRAEDRVVLRCDVAQLSGGGSESLCRTLLRANNLWAGTRGATLGLRGEDVVMLSESARIGSLSVERLAALVTGLRRQAEHWAGELAVLNVVAPAALAIPSHLRA